MAEFQLLPISPTNPVFKNAMYLAHAANAAYEDKGPRSYIEKYTKGVDVFGFTNEEVFAGPMDTQGFIANNENYVVLAFRGTEPNRLADIRTDLLASPRKWVVGEVHKGFSTALDGVINTCVELIRKYRDRDQKLYITGHSLGGALATLAGRWLAEQKDPILTAWAIYTFGAPRVGDQSFCSTYQRRLFRFVHGEDIIPHVPPPGSFMDAGSLLYLSQDGKVHFNSNNIPSFWSKLGMAAKEWITAKGDMSQAVPKWIQDHIMQSYIDRLQMILESGKADLFPESEPEGTEVV